MIVPEGFCYTEKGFKKLVKFIKPEYLETFKELNDLEIADMITCENKIARRRY